MTASAARIDDAEEPIGLGHLTLLDESPPSLVRVASAAGYAAVGLRLQPVHPTERAWPMLDGSSMLQETRRVLDDTGVVVWDVEVIRLESDFRARDVVPLLEAGTYLGARFVNVFPADPDLARLAASLGELAEVAGQYGIKPLVEPMVYNALPDLGTSLDVLRRAGTPNLGLIVDALHFHRSGGVLDDLAGLDGGAVSVLQLCDAPWTPPEHITVPDGPLPRNQSSQAPVLALEGRAFRLLPGEGELPLKEMVARLPRTPISVEAPCFSKQQELAALQVAQSAFKAVQHILTAARQGV